jgi:hypothetical protein
MTTINLSVTQVLAGLGVLLTLLIMWRWSVRRARAAADAARAGARLLSLAGRVLFTAGLIVAVQWVVIMHPDNKWLLLAVLGVAGVVRLLRAHPRVDGDHYGRSAATGWSAMTRKWNGWGRVAASGRSPVDPQNARHVGPTRAEKLARDAAVAAELRVYQTHPDVVALRVERVRTQVDRLCWAGIVLGLAFTMTNVQWFAAAGARPGSLPWLAAWVLDPTVSLVLLAILRGEQITARYQVHTGPWVRVAKWFTLAATYVMNTWASYAAGSLSGVVLHSVPPLVVFVAAEAVTDLRDKLTEAVYVAFTEAARRTAGDVHEPDRRAARPAGRPRARRAGRRKLFADYLAEAREAWSPGVVVTPAWVRQVTDCSRGLSSRLAATLLAELDHGGEAER